MNSKRGGNVAMTSSKVNGTIMRLSIVVPLGLIALLAHSPARAGDVDVAKSRIYVRVGKTGFGHEHGVEGRLKSGHLKLGATTDAGELVFDLASFEAERTVARKYAGRGGQ